MGIYRPKTLAWLGSFVALLLAGPATAQVVLEEIAHASLPDGSLEIVLDFSATPPVPEIFVIENPTRLAVDFPDVVSQLEGQRVPLDSSHADSLMLLEEQGSTRVVIDLIAPTTHTTRMQGDVLIIVIGSEASEAVLNVPVAAQSAGGAGTFIAPMAPIAQSGMAPSVIAPSIMTPAVMAPSAVDSAVTGLDFRRGEGGSGRIIIDMARAGIDASINRDGANLELRFNNASIADDMQMELDVTDFATPVQSVRMYADNGNIVVQAQVVGEYEYLASQSNGQYLIDVLPMAAAAGPTIATGADSMGFTGEPISLNFQDIDVRSVLQILADFNDFSLVVGDNVSGNITLRLDNVPWDQALDLVLRSRGLDQRLVANVLYVAPAAEIAMTELQALESTQQVEALAPLVMEYIEVNYAVASELLTLLQSESGGILSERGRASVDERTNTLIVQDVETVLNDIKALLARLDVPVRQVLIEARIVNASTSFSKALGVRWGGVQRLPGTGDQFIISNTVDSVAGMGSNIADFNQAVATAITGGMPLEQALATNKIAFPAPQDSLIVDLGVPSPSASIALGYAGNNGLLQLELSALESSGNGEVIAQPKVTTQDQQTARIESGVQIPFQSQAGGTAGGTTTEFVTAALSLEVTPQITPDGRIIMLLDIHQDSVVPGTGTVPAISTNSVNTRVLVSDGDTIVLGGVFREEITTTISKTPLLGDLPYLGNIFKRTQNSENKTELLIFITPSIINEIL